MKKLVKSEKAALLLCMGAIFMSSASFAQNCAWGNCTPQQMQQEYQRNQLNQLQGINNSLQQLQQQQQVAPAAGQWSNTPQHQQLVPMQNGFSNPPQTRQNCYRDGLGRIFCQ